MSKGPFSLEELSEIVGIVPIALTSDIRSGCLVVTSDEDGYYITEEDMVAYLEEVIDAPSAESKQEAIDLAVRRLDERD